MRGSVEPNAEETAPLLPGKDAVSHTSGRWQACCLLPRGPPTLTAALAALSELGPL